MVTREAMDIVSKFGIYVNAESFLDCIEKMDIAYHNGTLTDIQRIAYNIVIGEMEEFFAPVSEYY